MDALDTFLSGTEIVGAAGNARRGVKSAGGNLQRVCAGIPSSSLGAGLSTDVQVTVSEPFRPDKIILSVASQALNVTNIKIGTKSLNVTSNPISGNCFSEQAIGSHLEGYTAQPGVGFVISLQNPTGGAITIGGGVFGPALN